MPLFLFSSWYHEIPSPISLVSVVLCFSAPWYHSDPWYHGKKEGGCFQCQSNHLLWHFCDFCHTESWHFCYFCHTESWYHEIPWYHEPNITEFRGIMVKKKAVYTGFCHPACEIATVSMNPWPQSHRVSWKQRMLECRVRDLIEISGDIVLVSQRFINQQHHIFFIHDSILSSGTSSVPGFQILLARVIPLRHFVRGVWSHWFTGWIKWWGLVRFWMRIDASSIRVSKSLCPLFFRGLRAEWAYSIHGKNVLKYGVTWEME